MIFKTTHKKPEPNSIPQTNGEILYPSAAKLLTALPLTHHDIFLDLGSGLGKFVQQVFSTTQVREAHGIEISEELHHQALLATKNIQQPNHRKLNFIQGDFLEIPWPAPTVLFICATCYTQATLCAIGNIINHTPSIHTVMSLRPIPTLQRLPFKEVIRIECTWDTALCYVYKS